MKSIYVMRDNDEYEPHLMGVVDSEELAIKLSQKLGWKVWQSFDLDDPPQRIKNVADGLTHYHIEMDIRTGEPKSISEVGCDHYYCSYGSYGSPHTATSFFATCWEKDRERAIKTCDQIRRIYFLGGS